MPTPSPDAPEALCREILDEAARQGEAILERARGEARAILAEAEQEAARLASATREAARAEAQRRKEAILATVPVEAGRLWSARLEALLQSIRDAARDRLRVRDGGEYRAAIVRLAVDALAGMAGDSFILKTSPASRRVLQDSVAEQIRQRAARPVLTLEVREDPALRDDAIVLQDGEGRQLWNIAPEARLERLWPELRRQIVANTGLGETPPGKQEAA